MAFDPSEEDIRKLMESEEGQALLQQIMASNVNQGDTTQGGNIDPPVSDFDPPPLSLGNDRTTSIYDEYLNQEGLESVGADTPREYESGQPVPPMTPEELEKRRIEELEKRRIKDEDKFERRMLKALMEPRVALE